MRAVKCVLIENDVSILRVGSTLTRMIAVPNSSVIVIGQCRTKKMYVISVGKIGSAAQPHLTLRILIGVSGVHPPQLVRHVGYRPE